MKNLALIVLLLGLNLSNTFSQCRISDIVSANRSGFDKGFSLDGFSYFKFEFNAEKQVIHKEFLALKGKKYQLLYCCSGFAETVSIHIYDGDNNLLGGSSVGGDKSSNTFLPSKGGTLKIVYEIPPAELGVDHEECIALMIGVSEK
jgi:hypothetical protein